MFSRWRIPSPGLSARSVSFWIVTAIISSCSVCIRWLCQLSFLFIWIQVIFNHIEELGLKTSFQSLLDPCKWTSWIVQILFILLILLILHLLCLRKQIHLFLGSLFEPANSLLPNDFSIFFLNLFIRPKSSLKAKIGIHKSFKLLWVGVNGLTSKVLIRRCFLVIIHYSVLWFFIISLIRISSV